MSYPKPANENNRIEALRRFRLLDSTPESIYDDVVRIASALFGVPIAIISLIDDERQWFKAQVGLGVSETPREHAFCTYAILDSKTMIVEDAIRDERFSGNPLVTGDPRIRFYMGAPLITRAGDALGTLCVIDKHPRKPSSEEQRALESLRNIVMHLIESRNVNELLADALENVRTLEGLLPICSHCKSIRNDEGYWKQVEEYIGERINARFSHSICPACLKQHYPRYA